MRYEKSYGGIGTFVGLGPEFAGSEDDASGCAATGREFVEVLLERSARGNPFEDGLNRKTGVAEASAQLVMPASAAFTSSTSFSCTWAVRSQMPPVSTAKVLMTW